MQGRVRTAAILGLEAAILLYFAVGKTGFESRLAIGWISINQIAQILLGVGLVLGLWFGAPGRVLRSATLALVAVLTAALWIGTAGSHNSAYVFAKPEGYAGVVLPCLAVVAMCVRDEAYLRRLLYLWAALGMAMMLLGVAMLAAGAAPARLAVFGGGANVFARMVASAVVILVGLRPPVRWRHEPWLRALCLTGCAVTLLCAGSKTAVLGIGVGVGVLGIWHRRPRVTFATLAVMFVFAASPAVIHRLVQGANKDRGSIRMFRLPDTDDPHGSYGTRLQYYRASLHLLPTSGWRGVGTGDWGTAIHLPSGRRYPHNLVLELGTELGAFGFLCVALLGVMAWRWSRDLREAPGDPQLPATVLALFAFWMFNAQLSGDLLDNRNLWWPLLFLELLWLQRCRSRVAMQPIPVPAMVRLGEASA